MVCVCTSQYVEKVFVPYVLHIFFILKFYYLCKIKQENTKCHFKP